MVLIGKVLGYLFFYGILGIIIFSFYKGKTVKTEWLNKESTKELKGIAILMVLLGHLTYVFGLIRMPLTPALGAPAVDLFLFLSGFGLMLSYEKNGLTNFWKKRAAVIVVPYLLLTIIKIPYMLLLKMDPIEIIGNLTGILVSVDTSMWYVQYIILCYILFYAIFSIPKLNRKAKAFLLFGVAIILVIINGLYFYSENMPVSIPLNESYSHHLSFSVGILFCFLYEKIKKISVWKFAVISGVAFLLVQFVFFPGIDGYLKYYGNNLLYVVFLIFLWGVLKKRGKTSKILSFFGKLSYYIYLNEFIIMYSVYKYVPIHPGVQAVLIVLLSVLFAIPTKWLGDKIVYFLKKVIWINDKLKVGE